MGRPKSEPFSPALLEKKSLVHGKYGDDLIAEAKNTIKVEKLKTIFVLSS